MTIFKAIGIREGEDRTGEALIYNMAVCYGLAEKRIGVVLGRYGLSPVKMNALLIIKHIGGSEGLPQHGISERMIVTAGNITRLLDRMDKDGLIRRVVKKDDRRIKQVVISDKASKLLDRVWPVYKEEVEKIASLLNNKELESATNTLNKLRIRLNDKRGGK